MRSVDKTAQTNLATRRVFLFRGMTGAAALSCSTRSVAALTEANTASCTLTAEQTVGPYYLDLERVRQNITEGRSGIPLRLRVTIVDAKRCLPIENAALDIWHCDALGVYSGFTSNSPDESAGMPPPHRFGGPPPGPPPDASGEGPPGLRPDGDGFRPGGPPPEPSQGFGNRQHDNTTFLRGVQLTDHAGVVEFSTIYPGWYMGRDIHIHMRVHVGGSVIKAKYDGGQAAYTGQLFFPEDVSDAVARCQPYESHHTDRTRQDEDDVFRTQHGAGSVVTLARLNKREIEGGFMATAVLGIDPNAISKDMGPGGRGGRPPGPPPESWPGAPPDR